MPQPIPEQKNGPTYTQPIEGGELNDGWGNARSGGRRHEGIDIMAERGTPIHAVTSGTVVQGFHNDLGGVVVRIEGDDGRYYYYAHLNEGSVDHLRVGQRVETGAVIGGVGNTGNARGADTHLHLGIKDEQGEWINPYDFLVDLPTDGYEGGDGVIDPPAAAPGVDTDRDGILDEAEVNVFGTDPNKADTDGDGLSDAYEIFRSKTDPLNADTDLDGKRDDIEIGDGTDPTRGTDRASAIHIAPGTPGADLDTDKDGLSDAYEIALGTDPNNPDSDFDRLSDSLEIGHGTEPLKIDSDGDGIGDGTEVEYGTDPLHADDFASFGMSTTDDIPATDTNGNAVLASVEPGEGTELSAAQICQLLDERGFDREAAEVFTAIALAESRGRTDAHAQDADDDSLGLFQINLLSDPNRANQWPNLFDPVQNVDAAWTLSNGGTNLRPWSVTREEATNSYLNFMDEARAGANEYFAALSAGVGTSGVDVVPNDDATSPHVEEFVQLALSQEGDEYERGPHTAAGGKVIVEDPHIHDCSELVEWALAKGSGLEISEASYLQFPDIEKAGLAMSVEAAINTRGALLFSTGSDGKIGHVAISLGDGRTIEARGEKYGVGIFDARDRFDFAGLVPGLDYSTAAMVSAPGVDSDRDGILDDAEVKVFGTDPSKADTDGDGLSDAYEIFRSKTDPLNADTDLDGKRDDIEIGDGTDPTRGTDRASAIHIAPGTPGADLDTDKDGLSDAYEIALGTDPNNPDSDFDRLSDSLEIGHGTEPLKIDSDGDGIGDGTEVEFGTDPLASDVFAGFGTPDFDIDDFDEPTTDTADSGLFTG